MISRLMKPFSSSKSRQAIENDFMACGTISWRQLSHNSNSTNLCIKGGYMKTDSDNKNDAIDLKCPECRSQLKERRSRTPDKCKLICGGCGLSFDVCDLETLDALKNQS